MRKPLKPLIFLSLAFLVSCSGGGGTNMSAPPPPQNIQVTVQPPFAFTGFIGVKQSLQFTATVSGTSNQNITWTVNGIAGGNSVIGIIGVSGLFTAPNQIPNPQKVTITATSQADTTKSASTAVFVSRIPPSGSWQRTGPPGGTITVLTEDISHPGTVYAGTDLGNIGALWKSADFGLTWSPIVTNSLMDANAAFDVAVPASGGGSIIYVCNSGFGLSQDSGATWTQIKTPAACRGMAVDPQNRQVIYLSAPGSGLLKSQDGGATWALLAGSPVITTGSAAAILHNPITVDLTRESTVYYGTNHGMFVSQDAGNTWTQSTNGFAAGDTAVRDVAVDPANTGAVFALAGGSTSAVVALYETTDRGSTWTLVSSGLDGERLVPDPVNVNTIYLSGLQLHAVYKSIDGGHSFASSDTGMPSGSSGGGLVFSGPTGTLVPLTARPGWFLSSIGGVGIFRSQNAAQSWAFSSTGTSSWQGHALAIDGEQPTTVYLATSQNIFKSIDSGATWTVLHSGGSFAIAVDPFASNHLIAEFTGQGLLESHDGGATWSAVTNLPPIPNGGNAIITAIAFNPKAQGTVFISTGGTGNVGVLRSTDGGATYTLANAGLTSFQASAIAVNPQTPSMLFVGTAAGVFKSTDNGTSWGLSNPNRAGLISFDANTTPPTVYINGAKSTDLGTTWTSIPQGAGGIIVDPSTPNSIFAFGADILGPTAPVWSPDGGITFFPLNSGLGESNLFSGFGAQGIVIAPNSPQTLFVGSLTNSMLRFVVGP